jgi:thiol-disulfide isomerase/thioredoxin
MKKIIGLAMLVIGIVSAEPKYDKKVMILTNKNFEEERKQNEYLLVEFYAPWCQHCKDFAPQYQTVAKKLL